METDAEWLYADGDAFAIYKSVVERTAVRVPAGTFDCWKISWRWVSSSGDALGQVELVDYIADIGVVARYVRVRDLNSYPATHPESGGYYDAVEYIELTEYELIEKSCKVRPSGRVDHNFVYERFRERIGEARYRLRLTKRVLLMLTPPPYLGHC